MKALLRSENSPTKSVGFLAFDGVNILDLAGPLEAFTSARTDGDAAKDRRCYDTRVLGIKPRMLVSASGLGFSVKHTLSKPTDLDTLIIPGGAGLRDSEAGGKIAEWLREHAFKLNRIVAVCGGVYPLAQSGLLDGRKVATHWRVAQDLARRFPKVRVDPAAVFLKDGPFYTCAGGTAPTELSLALIEEDYGPRVALSVAREHYARLRPLSDNASSLDQSQFESGPEERLAELPGWIAAHLDENLSVEALAQRTCLCPRHFGRLFKRTFHSTPATFVETLRINEAKRRLLGVRGSVESVAVAVGFKDPDSFRRAFERCVGVTPAIFRRQQFAVVSDSSAATSASVIRNRREVATSPVGQRRRSGPARHILTRPARA